MSFMTPVAWNTQMFSVETSAGTELVPADVVADSSLRQSFSDFVHGELLDDWDYEILSGWFSRFSAPGYLDCTDWGGPYTTKKLALDALAELHDVCPACFEDCENSPKGVCQADTLAQ